MASYLFPLHRHVAAVALQFCFLFPVWDRNATCSHCFSFLIKNFYGIQNEFPVDLCAHSFGACWNYYSAMHINWLPSELCVISVGIQSYRRKMDEKIETISFWWFHFAIFSLHFDAFHFIGRLLNFTIRQKKIKTTLSLASLVAIIVACLVLFLL